MTERITTDLLMAGYSAGVFPMAEDADSDELYWYDPPMRGVILPETLHISRTTRKLLKRVHKGLPDAEAGDVCPQDFAITTNRAFREVMRLCGSAEAGRDGTWINAEIMRLYGELHGLGIAHSVEVWAMPAGSAETPGKRLPLNMPLSEDTATGGITSDPVQKKRLQAAGDPAEATLIGGLYGVQLGGAFFGESMFSLRSGGSRIALSMITEALFAAGFQLFDTQYPTPHLETFGCTEIERAEFQQRLALAIEAQAEFPSW